MSRSALEMIGKGLIAITLCAALTGCGSEARGARGDSSKRVLVIGMDGMDATLFKQMMDEGRLPNFSKLAARGGFKPLATAMPPQSPVAWANFISGSHPGKHQIYDFIHRDPNPPGKGLAVMPYQSISKQQEIEPAWYNPLSYTDWEGIPWGKKWRLPLRAQETISMRRGDNFWDFLTARDIDTVVYRVPANYPPDDADGSSHFSCISGMGTPELRGGDGEFTRYDEDAPLGGSRPSGGRLVKLFLSPQRHSTKCTIVGPDNFLQKPKKRGGGVDRMKTSFDLVRDPVDEVAKITLNDQVIVLRKGEWSAWTTVTFETGIPAAWLASMLTVPTSASGMVRFKLLSVHPKLALFMSPVHFDPLNPASPISSPPEFATEVAEDVGRYHTTGIPQEHKALRHGALSEDDFLEQARTVLDERTAQYRRALAEFESGFLFFYFGATDLLGHMFWRDRDPGHPGLKPGEAEKYGKVIENSYVDMDGLVGEALEALDDDDTLIVMSDHGFGSFRRQFNLNTWLVEQGYMVLYDREGMDKREYQIHMFINVDWSQTKAYALGINSLYINAAGREKNGIVPESERLTLTKEIGEKMLLVRDEYGDPAIHKYYITEQVYPGADPAIAPDMLVGYAKNYRASWATALGGMPKKVIQDNMARWSGDHCVAADLVPGIIVTNRKITVDDPKLEDVAPTILAEFGVGVPETMTGRPLFRQN